MNDPFFAEDDGEFDDFYGNGARKSTRPSQAPAPQPSQPIVDKTTSLVYPDTPSSVASFVSRSTDNGTSYPSGNNHKKTKKLRRKRSQERFEVEWEKDDVVTACFVCGNEFSLLKRKHHCRHCGRVICSECSSYRRLGSSKGKHRVCSFCSVDIANGGGRATLAGASLSDAEAATPHHHDEDWRGSKLRQSIAGVFSSKSTDSRSQVPHSSYETRTNEPTSELFDTSDDAWFGDPSNDRAENDKRGRKQDRHSQTRVPTKQKDTYVRPQVVSAPDSLFDVQFTNGNQYEGESDEDHDDFAMPRPTSQSEMSTSRSQANEFTTSSRHSMVARLDAPLTVEDLQASSTSASYVSSISQYETALVVVPPISVRKGDRTFYNDDVDQLVVDDAPGYYDSVRERNHTQNVTSSHSHPGPMPRPSGLAAVSNGSSGVLVEAPEASASAAQAVVEKDEDRSPEGKGFAGALKRFFGISKNKRNTETKDTKTNSASAKAEKPPAPQPPQSNSVSAISPGEDRVGAEMPKPTFIPPAQSDHYYGLEARSPNDDVYDVRHTIADGERPIPEPSSDGFDASLRHTMSGYVVPSTRANTLMRASVVGTGVTSEPAPQQVLQKKGRSSTRSRRDTFDDLFDMPSSMSKVPTSAPVLPTQSWAPAYDAAPATVGVDRFDRPRRENEDDDITRGLGLSANDDRRGVDNRASESKTPWSAVSSFMSTGSTATYATPGTYGSSRESTYYTQYDTQVYQAHGVTNEYDTGDALESGRGSNPNRSIMDDLIPKSTSQSPRNTMSHKNSVDDYFADFENPTEYVFDTVTGTYVSANPKRARQSVTDPTANYAGQPSPAYKKMDQRDERLRATPRNFDPLEPVNEDVSDEIDGIIADKISTLAGELEALKQLLRQRRVRGSPTSVGKASTATRKQSIFDSDGSDEEVKPRAIRPSKSKRSSSLKKSEGGGRRVGHTRRQPRKDSFADLFEDDAEDIGERQGYANRNYEALFQLGQDNGKSADYSDDDSGDKKLSERTRKRTSRTRKQNEISTNSDSENEGLRGDAPSSSRFKALTEEPHVSSIARGEVDDNTQALVTVTATRKAETFTKKPKRDAIDSLFDSDSDGDMGQLYEATGASRLPTGTHRSKYALDATSDPENDADERVSKYDQPLPNDARIEISHAIVPVGAKTVGAPSVDTHGVSSDEEFSSTLKNLRGRRKTRTTSVRAPTALPSRETIDPDDGVIGFPVDQSNEGRRLSTSSNDEERIPVAATSENPMEVTSTEDHQNLTIGEPDSTEHTFIAADVKRDAEMNHELPNDPDAHLEHEEVADAAPVTEAIEYSTTSDIPDFDPLAMLDDEKEGSFAPQQPSVAASTANPLGASTEWESHAGSFMEKFKTSRFRDSLLDDSSADVLGTSTNLNLDDLFGEKTGEDHGEGEHVQSSEDEQSFSFEVKPRKRTSKTQLTPHQPAVEMLEKPEMPATDSIEIMTSENGINTSANAVEDKQVDVLDSIAEKTSTVSVSLPLIDEGAPVLNIEVAQFEDDWQRMQEQEKERKKKLQMKQRQAQRDKLKKQASSVRSLGKSVSTRSFVPPSPTSSTLKTSTADNESVDGSDPKKKKKHRKKMEDGNGDDDMDSRAIRKSEKRRHKHRVPQPEAVQVQV